MSARALPGVGDKSKEIFNPNTPTQAVVDTYVWCMRKNMSGTLAKGAIPLVCSPSPHNIWGDGQVVRNAVNDCGWARQVAPCDCK